MQDLEKLTKEEIETQIKILEKMGFQYLQGWQMEFYTPDRYKLPSGTILDEDELCNFFEKTKPEIGNKKHLEIINAFHYHDLINSELFTENRFTYESFIDEKDEKKCRKKYNT
jgi:hypothetical protein